MKNKKRDLIVDLKTLEAYQSLIIEKENNKGTHFMHITPIGGNVFADLGFDPVEAAALQAKSQHIISEKLEITQFLLSAEIKS